MTRRPVAPVAALMPGGIVMMVGPDGPYPASGHNRVLSSRNRGHVTALNATRRAERDRLQSGLIEIVRSTMKPAHASLWIDQNGQTAGLGAETGVR